MKTVTVIVPVKDGVRYLKEVLEAIASQQIDAEVETIVVDSGSSDGSLEIARVAGATLVQIPAAEFGHGRTRNLAAERASGDVLVFLTQDATPAGDDWLAELVAPLDARAQVGLSFGPHLPRADTSPTVANELDSFFGSFSPNGSVRIDASIDVSDPASGFFSNVNSAILRECWQQIRFREIPYAEDQAFARDALAGGWSKAYVPSAGVLHAHDYPFTQFMRRYFDEYRGLRESVGHVQTKSPSAMVDATKSGARRDLAYMRERGYRRGRRVLWGARSVRHHAGKALFSALGSRAQRLPERVRSALSLEGRGDAAAGRRRFMHVKGNPEIRNFEYVLEGRKPAAALAGGGAFDATAPIEIAWLVPPFRRGSGGHMTIFTLIDQLEQLGHNCSIWIQDPNREMKLSADEARREITEQFAPLKASVQFDLDGWQGSQVALATGWQTAYPLHTLAGCALKGYLVQDHEPEFYGTSASRMWSEATYGMDFLCICASPWLRDLMRERYGARAEAFELGVDFDLYKPLGRRRDPATILYYARPSTPRRATEMGMLALAQVVKSRPDTRVIVFGDTKPKHGSFDFELAGIVDQATLAELYNEATVGLVISMTNYSRMPKEMMACGLPVVDVDHPSVISVFGDGGEAIALAKPDPISIADRVGELLGDPDARERQAAAAREFVSGMTWREGALDIERHLRGALAKTSASEVAAGTRE